MESLQSGQVPDKFTTDLTSSKSSPPTSNNKKRHLPLWMLGVTGAEGAEKKESLKANRSKKSQKENGVCKEEIEVGKFEENEVRPRRTTTKIVKNLNLSRSRATKNEKQIDVEDSSVKIDGGTNVPKGRKPIGSVSRTRMTRPRARKKKGQQFENGHEEDPISEVDEDCLGQSRDTAVESGLDLTVEDLLIMAKQRVEAEQITEIQDTGANVKDGLRELEKPSKKVTSVFCNNEWRDLSYSWKSSEAAVSATQNTNKVLSNTNLGRDEISASMYQSQSNTAPVKLGNSDDIAQNMLDLLLGPALGYSQNEDKKSQDLLEEVDSVLHSNEPEKRMEEAPLFKKKSSLRDKVSMLLS